MKRINENDAPSRQQHIQVDMRRTPSDHLYVNCNQLLTPYCNQLLTP